MNNDRQYWLDCLLKITTPVLESLANDELRNKMPVESQSDIADRKNYTYLEAFGRTVVGMAPWLGCQTLEGEEEKLRRHYAELVRQCLS
ncbi:MAG: DUF2264 domain-containing protein, partial [Victivallales bacterium]|nr:DUF2264 domain-containing protein [Victivallales bacterium]